MDQLPETVQEEPEPLSEGGKAANEVIDFMNAKIAEFIASKNYDASFVMQYTLYRALKRRFEEV